MINKTNLIFFYNGKVMELFIPDKLLSVEYVEELFKETKDGINLKEKLNLLGQYSFTMRGFSVDTNLIKKTVTHVFYIGIDNKK